MPKRLALALGVILSLSQPVSAQAVGSASGLSGSIFKLMNQVGTLETPAPGGQKATAPAPVVQPAALNFKVSPAIRQKVITAFVDQISEGSPEAGAEWTKLFRSTDVFAEVDKQVKTMFGLSSSNLADTWAVYWSYAWLMTQSRTDDPTKAQVVGLRDQFHPILRAIPSVAALSDAQKQEMSDTLMLQVVMFGALAEAWKDDKASRDEFGTGLQEGTQALGLDLGTVTLSEQGFKVSP